MTTVVVADATQAVRIQKLVKFLMGKGFGTLHAGKIFTALFSAAGLGLSAANLHQQIATRFQVGNHILNISGSLPTIHDDIEDIGGKNQVDIEPRVMKLIGFQ